MKRFFKDLKKYKNYIVYATWAELKSEVIGSYLGWLWLILEPLCFMLIYTFLAGILDIFEAIPNAFSKTKCIII